MGGQGAVPEQEKLLLTATAVSDWQAAYCAAAPAAHLKSICDEVRACFRLQLLDLLRAMTAQTKLNVASTALLSSKLEQSFGPTCMMRLTAGFRTLNLPLALAIVPRPWTSRCWRTGLQVGPRALLQIEQLHWRNERVSDRLRPAVALVLEARTRPN